MPSSLGDRRNLHSFYHTTRLKFLHKCLGLLSPSTQGIRVPLTPLPLPTHFADAAANTAIALVSCATAAACVSACARISLRRLYTAVATMMAARALSVPNAKLNPRPISFQRKFHCRIPTTIIMPPLSPRGRHSSPLSWCTWSQIGGREGQACAGRQGCREELFLRKHRCFLTPPPQRCAPLRA